MAWTKEEMCEKAMENAAYSDKYSCTFTIKQLNPGLPIMTEEDVEYVFNWLFKKLCSRKGIMCCGDKELPNTLVISWAHTSAKKS